MAIMIFLAAYVAFIALLCSLFRINQREADE